MLSGYLLAQTNLNTLVPPTSVAGNFASGLGILAALLGLIICVLWIVFPFIVLSKFNSLERLQQRQISLLEEIVRSGQNTASSGKSPIPPNYASGLTETSSAGWIVGILAVLILLGLVVVFAAKS